VRWIGSALGAEIIMGHEFFAWPVRADMPYAGAVVFTCCFGYSDVAYFQTQEG